MATQFMEVFCKHLGYALLAWRVACWPQVRNVTGQRLEQAIRATTGGRVDSSNEAPQGEYLRNAVGLLFLFWRSSLGYRRTQFLLQKVWAPSLLWRVSSYKNAATMQNIEQIYPTMNMNWAAIRVLELIRCDVEAVPLESFLAYCDLPNVIKSNYSDPTGRINP